MLTKRQAELLVRIVASRSPTVRWLGEALGISSKNAVHDKLKALRRMGCLTWEPTRHGTLRALVIPSVR